MPFLGIHAVFRTFFCPNPSFNLVVPHVLLFDSDTARLWTTLTAAVVGADALAAIPLTVPEHAYFPLYGPDFQMSTREKTLPDKNDEVFLVRCGNTFCGKCGTSRAVCRGGGGPSFRKSLEFSRDVFMLSWIFFSCGFAGGPGTL